MFMTPARQNIAYFYKSHIMLVRTKCRSAAAAVSVIPDFGVYYGVWPHGHQQGSSEQCIVCVASLSSVPRLMFHVTARDRTDAF